MAKKKITWHNLNSEKVFKALASRPEGLTEAEVGRRQKKYGRNILSGGEKFSSWRLFWSQFKSALVYVLVIAGLISFIFGELIDTYVIFAAVFLNIIIGFFQEKKANKSLEKLQSVVKQEAIVLRGQQERIIEANDLVAGDVIILKAGDRVPADARLISADNFEVNEANLTGESWPEKKQVKELKIGTPLGDRTNMVFMGTLAVTGRATALVTAIGAKTEIGQIAESLLQTEEERTPLQKKLDKFAKNLTGIIVAIAALIFALGVIRGEGAFQMFSVSVALAVAAIPEGLLIGVTMILTVGMQRILKHNGLVRKLISAETLGSTTLICSDKTGTITEGEMRVTNIMTGSHNFSLTGGALKDIEYDNEIKRLMEISVLCNDAVAQNPDSERDDWEIIGSPTEKAILLFGSLDVDINEAKKHFARSQEIPFDSSVKYMITRHHYNQHQDIVFMKGAPEKILDYCSHYLIADRSDKLSAAKIDYFQKGWQDLSLEGLRVLGGAFRLIKKEEANLDSWPEGEMKNFTFSGFWGLEDPLRPEAKETLQQALAAGIRTVIITGDNKFTASKVAAQLGLKVEDNQIITGEEMLKLSEEQLDQQVDKLQIYARVSPGDKLRIIKAAQKKGEVVSMTGDGVNDAPALKAADIGVVVSSGSDVAKEVADLVLLDNNFKTIVMAIKQGRVIFDNVRKVILYLLSDSFCEIIIISLGILMGFPLPLLTAQILWINLVDDGLPALALTMEPEDPDIMEQRTGKIQQKLFDFKSKFLIATISSVVGLAGLAIFYIFWQKTGDIDLARTVIFTFLSLSTLFYVFSIRNLKHSIFTANPFKNMYLNFAVIFGIIFQLLAIYLPFLNNALHTVPLGQIEWEAIMALIASVILVIEVIKYIFIHYQRLARK